MPLCLHVSEMKPQITRVFEYLAHVVEIEKKKLPWSLGRPIRDAGVSRYAESIRRRQHSWALNEPQLGWLMITDHCLFSLLSSIRSASEKRAQVYGILYGGRDWDTSYTNRHMHLQPKERPDGENAASPQIGLSCCEKIFHRLIRTRLPWPDRFFSF